MTMLDAALALARKGFFVFPIAAGKKSPPAVSQWQEKASRDPQVITNLWRTNHEYNVGICCNRFGDLLGSLLVVDIDSRPNKNGYAALLQIELIEGLEMPATYTQHTPSGGQHLIYYSAVRVRQGTDLLGRGVDVRSTGGYIVGPGSRTSDGNYRAEDHSVDIACAPQWLVERLRDRSENREPVGVGHVTVNPLGAERRVIHYLTQEAPIAIQGQSGDAVTYKVAQACKDFGAWPAMASALMAEHWNPRCVPPWDTVELQRKVQNAFLYGKHTPGIAAPEAVFNALDAAPSQQTTEQKQHPLDALNKDYAFVIAGGGAHILYETTDVSAVGVVEHVTLDAFRQKFAPVKMQIGDKTKSVASIWLEWKERRSYDGIVFQPGQPKDITTDGGKMFFNLWRGFSVEPAERGATHPSVGMFLEHLHVNVCRGNHDLSKWLINYFAHIVQRPYEKPLVALVFRGGKGVGKNALIERVGALLGRHFLLTSNRRYLLGNFNGHLESCLLFALDEAFWSGDKQAEGVIKDLITGREHVIEHKGKEPYTVANRTRVVIIGNEDWLIPASVDERRYAVFDVGEGRKQDREFFKAMREGMERGGYAVLLRYLLDVDLSKADVNHAPSTQGLIDQKLHSLGPLYQWWAQCIEEESIVGGDFVGWPASVETDSMKRAFMRYVKESGLKLWHHEDSRVFKMLRACCPSIERRRAREGADLRYLYYLPPFPTAVAEWNAYLGTAPAALESVLD